MYRTLFRKTIRAVVIGTSLSVFPAVPFYIYTFDATPRQLAILVPLFVPALLSMLLSDLFLIRYYLEPVRVLFGNEDRGIPSDQELLYSANQRALNFPVFAVLRVFLPHAVIGSGVFNLLIIVANAYLSLGINPGDYPMYWVINLTVVPVAHAVYEYFELAKAMIPTLQVLEAKIPSLPAAYRSRVVSVRLATKVIVIFIMLGMAPLFILGVSLYKKHTSLLVEKEQKNLLHEAHVVSALLHGVPAVERLALMERYSYNRMVIAKDSL